MLLGVAAMASVISLATLALLIGFGRRHGGKHGGAVEIEWPASTTPEQAAALLANAGLADTPSTLAVFLRATGGTDAFVPGLHFIPEGSTPFELRALLSRSPKRPTAHVAIPEGFTRYDVAARLERLHVVSKRAFLEASADPLLLDELGIERGGAVGAESVEGYLFPATYDLGLDTDARDVVHRLVGESDKRWNTIAADHADGFASIGATLGWGRREVMILASIIQKEAMMDDERPVIASVFFNRLTSPEFHSHKLQSDPTSVYGCLVAPDDIPACATYLGKPTPALNQDPANRYSTYVHAGLPPGPICNPGARSIEAVLTPAPTSFFYFVAAGNGRHTFSETLEAHTGAIQKLRAATRP